MHKYPTIFLNVLFLASLLFSPLRGNESEKRRVLFLVNTLAEEIGNCNFSKLVDQYLDKTKFETKILYLQTPLQASTYALEAKNQSIDIIVAVGEDSMVNEVGKVVVDSNTALAIIPTGTGSKIASHLGVPSVISQALIGLNQANIITVDTAKINDHLFLGVAGIGLDAHLAFKLSSEKKNLAACVEIALSEYARYNCEKYLITVDGKPLSKEALLICFANGSKYTDDFIIAPFAKVQDGFLDLVIVKDIPFYAAPGFIYSFKQGLLHESSYVEIYRCKEVVIKQKNCAAQVDGKPMLLHNDITVKIQPASLKILAPRKLGAMNYGS